MRLTDKPEADKSTGLTMTAEKEKPEHYVLDEQVGFVLRLVQQRHTMLFAESFENDLTPTQWAVIAKLKQIGACSQNLLGRHTAMDVATIQGVVDRLRRRGFVTSEPDPDDRRRVVLTLSDEGEALFERRVVSAFKATEATLEPLSAAERRQLKELLQKLT
jgi:MarR family transcriptional regulator, lower aerobic nicotinate degradation pathway regulator